MTNYKTSEAAGKLRQARAKNPNLSRHQISLNIIAMAVDGKLQLTGPYHLLDDDKIVSKYAHPVATMSEPSHRQVATSNSAVTSDDGLLFTASYDLLQEYLRLRRLAIEYFEAEGAYRAALLRVIAQGIGPVETGSADKAYNAGGALIQALSLDGGGLRATLGIEQRAGDTRQ